MVDIQILPQKTKKFFRVVIFLKEKGVDVDATLSVTFQLPRSREVIFLPAAKGAQNYVYPESSSRFIHRIEKGIYLIHSKNKELFSAKTIAVSALFKGSRFEALFSVR